MSQASLWIVRSSAGSTGVLLLVIISLNLQNITSYKQFSANFPYYEHSGIHNDICHHNVKTQPKKWQEQQLQSI